MNAIDKFNAFAEQALKQGLSSEQINAERSRIFTEEVLPRIKGQQPQVREAAAHQWNAVTDETLKQYAFKPDQGEDSGSMNQRRDMQERGKAGGIRLAAGALAAAAKAPVKRFAAGANTLAASTATLANDIINEDENGVARKDTRLARIAEDQTRYAEEQRKDTGSVTRDGTVLGDLAANANEVSGSIMESAPSLVLGGGVGGAAAKGAMALGASARVATVAGMAAGASTEYPANYGESRKSAETKLAAISDEDLAANVPDFAKLYEQGVTSGMDDATARKTARDGTIDILAQGTATKSALIMQAISTIAPSAGGMMASRVAGGSMDTPIGKAAKKLLERTGIAAPRLDRVAAQRAARELATGKTPMISGVGSANLAVREGTEEALQQVAQNDQVERTRAGASGTDYNAGALTEDVGSSFIAGAIMGQGAGMAINGTEGSQNRQAVAKMQQDHAQLRQGIQAQDERIAQMQQHGGIAPDVIDEQVAIRGEMATHFDVLDQKMQELGLAPIEPAQDAPPVAQQDDVSAQPAPDEAVAPQDQPSEPVEPPVEAQAAPAQDMPVEPPKAGLAGVSERAQARQAPADAMPTLTLPTPTTPVLSDEEFTAKYQEAMRTGDEQALRQLSTLHATHGGDAAKTGDLVRSARAAVLAEQAAAQMPPVVSAEPTQGAQTPPKKPTKPSNDGQLLADPEQQGFKAAIDSWLANSRHSTFVDNMPPALAEKVKSGALQVVYGRAGLGLNRMVVNNKRPQEGSLFGLTDGKKTLVYAKSGTSQTDDQWRKGDWYEVDIQQSPDGEMDIVQKAKPVAAPVTPFVQDGKVSLTENGQSVTIQPTPTTPSTPKPKPKVASLTLPVANPAKTANPEPQAQPDQATLKAQFMQDMQTAIASGETGAKAKVIAAAQKQGISRPDAFAWAKEVADAATPKADDSTVDIPPVEPVSAVPEAPVPKAKQLEQMQPNDIGRPSDGKPFANKNAATLLLKKDGLEDDHEVVQVGKGAQFVIRAKTPTMTDQEVIAEYAKQEKARLSEEKTITQKNGNPFKRETSAQEVIDKHDLSDTHKIDEVDGGFVVKKMTIAEKKEASDKKNGVVDYMDIQEHVLNRLGLGESKTSKDAGDYGEVDSPALTDSQWQQVEGQVNLYQKHQRDAVKNGQKPINIDEFFSELKPSAVVAKTIIGPKIDDQWSAFTPESKTLNIPRAEMPQIKAEYRGAMVNFLNARGVSHEQVEVPAQELKPTQQEFSPEKVIKAKAFEGGDRSILISSDNHVLDGHHQWMSKYDTNEPVKAIRLNAPIKDLLETVKAFPSAETSDESSTKTNQSSHDAVEVKVNSELSHRIPSKLMDRAIRLGDVVDDLAQMTSSINTDVQYGQDLLRTIARLNPSINVHIVSDLNSIQDKTIRANLLAGGFYVPEQNTAFVYPKSEDWVGSALELVNHELVHAATEQSITDGLMSEETQNKLNVLVKKTKEMLFDGYENLSENANDRLAYALQTNPLHEIIATGVAESEVRQALEQIIGVDGLRQLDFIFTDISTQQATQNGTRNKGRDDQGSTRNVPRSLPVTDTGAAATVQGVSTADTGRKNDTRSTASNQADIPARKTESAGVEQGADGSQIATQQSAQNEQRKQGRNLGDGEKAVLGNLPKTDEGAAAAVPELSSKSTGGQDANGGARSGRAGISAGSTKSADVTSDKIADFGEKIGGAKKDLWNDYKKSLSDNLPTNAKEITLARHFPEPDYELLLSNNVSAEVLAAVKAMRDTIPVKPRQAYKLARWAGQLKVLREFANDLISGTISLEQLQKKLSEGGSGLRQFLNQINLYADVGYPHFKQLSGVKLASANYSLFEGREYPKGIEKWVFDAPNQRSGYFDSKADAIAGIRQYAERKANAPATAKNTKLDIYRIVSTGDIVIGKKVSSGKYIDLKVGFDNLRSATEYLAAHQDELLKELQNKKDVPAERRSVNDPRTGEDYRKGESVTPEQFAKTFGFRGVEFGNYVESSRRQQDLNNAYDALLDLATILNIPSQAISLNGELGLAFGARGSGGKRSAAAHYERSNIVINLTKNSGAGSLAHEWWHALDNYFSRSRNEGNAYLSDKPRPLTLNDQAIRPEVLAAWKAVIDGIKQTQMPVRSKELDKARSNDYWSTVIEMTARAFERFVIDSAHERGISNDYLANIASEEGYARSEAYPYPKNDEAIDIAKAYQALFDALKTKQTEKGVALYSRQSNEVGDSVDKLLSSANNPSKPVQPKQTIAQVRDTLAQRFGEDVIAKLEADGKLEIIQSESDIPADAMRSAMRSVMRSVMAWHGSPHQFDKFSLGKIGTGEGAQRYGYGLYFASEQMVADWYKERLAKNQGTKGNLYKVELTPDEKDFLVWDALVSEQEGALAKAQDLKVRLENAGVLDDVEDRLGQTFDDWIGGELYSVAKWAAAEGHIPNIDGQPAKAASQYMHSLGFAGVKYLDAGVRQQGYSTFNYVLFDAAAVRVVERFDSQNANGIEGYFHNGKTVLIADNLSPDTIVPVLLHEMGGHAGFQSLLRPQVYDDLMAQFDRMVASGNPLAVAAKRRAESAESDQTRQRDEYLPYLITEASRAQNQRSGPVQAVLRMVKRMVNAVRAYLYDQHGVQIKLSADDIVALAERMVKQVSNAPSLKGNSRSNADQSNSKQDTQSPFDDAFTLSVDEKDRLAKDIDRLATSLQSYPQPVKMKMPPVLLALDGVREGISIQNLPLEMDKRTIRKIMGRVDGKQDEGHQLTLEQVMQLPSELADPVMVLESDTAGGLIVLTTLTGKDGNPVISAIHLNKKRGRYVVNELATAFSKNNFGNWLNQRADKVIYASHKKSQDFVRQSPLQLQGVVHKVLASGQKILTPSDIVNAGQVKFSRKEDAQEAALYAAAQSKRIKDWIGDKLNTMLHLALHDKQFRVSFDRLQAKLNQVSSDAFASIHAAPEILGRMETLGDAGHLVKGLMPSVHNARQDDIKAAGKALFEGTLTDKKVYTDTELRKLHHLNDKQVEIYRHSRSAIDQSLDRAARSAIMRVQLDAGVPFETIQTMLNEDIDFGTADKQARQVLQDLVNEKPMGSDERTKAEEGREQALKRLDDIIEKRQKLEDEGYAPLMRFGNHWLTIKDQTGETVVHQRYETEYERDKAVRQLKKVPEAVPEGHELLTGKDNPERFKLFGDVSPEAMLLFAKEVGLTNDEAHQAYLKLATANHSALRRLIHRKGIAGFSDDVQRVMAAFVMSTARHSAHTVFNEPIMESIREIKNADSQLQAQKMVEYAQDPREEGRLFKNLLFIYNMGMSVMFGLVNLTQPIMQTLPWLTREAGSKALPLIMRGLKQSMSSFRTGKIPDEYQAEYERAQREGHLDPANVWMLQGMERGKSGLTSNYWTALSQGMGVIAQVTETVNRRATLFAALQASKSMSDEQLANYGGAYGFAVQAIQETQGIYNKGNRPRASRGTVGSLIMVYKQFSIAYVEQMIRMARSPKWKGEDDKFRRSLMLMLALLWSLAGTAGLPFAENLMDVASAFMGWAGKPMQFEHEAKKVLGDDLADFIVNGPVNMGPVADVQGRTGMGRMLPATSLLDPTASKFEKESGFTNIFGASGGLLQKAADAYQSAGNGQYANAAMQLMPRSATSAAKAIDMATTGEYRNAKGNKVTYATGFEALVKALDGNPARIADETRKMMEAYSAKDLQSGMQKRFNDQFIEAVAEKDAEGRRDVLRRIKVWNKENPEYRVKLNPSTVRRKLRDKESDWRDRVNMPKGMQQWVD